MDASDLLPSKALFGDGLGEHVVAGCCLSVAAFIAVVASFRSCVHLIPSGIQGIGLLLTVEGEKQSAGSGLQLSLTDVRLP